MSGNFVFRVEGTVDQMLYMMEVTAAGERDARERARTLLRREHPQPAVIDVIRIELVGKQLPLWVDANMQDQSDGPYL